MVGQQGTSICIGTSEQERAAAGGGEEEGGGEKRIKRVFAYTTEKFIRLLADDLPSSVMELSRLVQNTGNKISSGL